MRFMKRTLLFMPICLIMACSFSSSRKYAKVEVKPGIFAVFKMASSGQSYILFKDKEFEFIQVQLHYEPISIVLHEDLIYAVVVDYRALQPDEHRMHFYRQEGEELLEIPYSKFPKQIAVNNIFFDENDDSTKKAVEVAYKRDFEDGTFQFSYTASMWYYLEYGKFYIHYSSPQPIKSEFLNDFQKKHDPILWKFEAAKLISKDEAMKILKND